MIGAGLEDRLAIRELIEDWVVWRDSFLWARFRNLWHPEGQMWATWFQGPFEEFIRVTEEGYAKGVRIMHFLGGSSIELRGTRAIAQSRVTICQRGPLDGVLCDVTCSGRFYDFLEKRKDRWGLVLRRLTYERDRLDPVEPGAAVSLDRTLLEKFPVGYRHLAYLQTKAGYKVKADLPGMQGPETDALYARGDAWLRGEPL